MELGLNGRRVVVAGGSRGIGRAIAIEFAREGAAVSICARGAGALDAARADIAALGGTVHAASCDLSDPAAIAGYIPAAAEALGGIDILINNATGYGRGNDEESWETSLSVDLLAAVRASREALPFLEKGRDAAIVNIASGSGINPSVRTPAYPAFLTGGRSFCGRKGSSSARGDDDLYWPFIGLTHPIHQGIASSRLRHRIPHWRTGALAG